MMWPKGPGPAATASATQPSCRTSASGGAVARETIVRVVPWRTVEGDGARHVLGRRRHVVAASAVHVHVDEPG